MMFVARHISTLSAVALLALAALTYGGLVWFAVPQPDDFERANHLLNASLGAAILDSYLGWSGRWANVAAQYAMLRVIPLDWGYALLVALAGVPLLGSLLVFCRVLAPALRWSTTLVVTALFAVLCWTRAPGHGQTYFWWCGAMAYNLGLANVILILGWVFVRLGRPSAERSLLSRVTVIALGVLLGGMHEVFAIAILVLALVMVIFPRGRCLTSRATWIPLVASLVVGLATNVAAPGNAARFGVMSSPSSLLQVVAGVLGQAHHHLLPWMTDLGTWLALYLWMDMVGDRHRLIRPAGGRQGATAQVISLRTVVAASVLALGSLFAVPVAIYGDWTPGRVSSAYHVVFLVLGALLVAHAARTHGDLLACVRGFGWYPKARTAATVLFALSLYGGGWLSSDFYDLIRRAPHFHAAMVANHKVLLAAARDGQRQAQVVLVRDWPRAYLPDDGDAVYGRYWREPSVSLHYGLAHIEAVLPPSLSPPR